jgi:GTP-dependent phosphoenolpyruvate carboxykinase
MTAETTDKPSNTHGSSLHATTHAELQAWVDQVAELTQPDRVPLV